MVRADEEGGDRGDRRVPRGGKTTGAEASRCREGEGDELDIYNVLTVTSGILKVSYASLYSYGLFLVV